MPPFEGNFLTQRHEICSQETRDSRLSYGEHPESLSHLGFNRYRVVTTHGRTDGRTDRQNYDSFLHLVSTRGCSLSFRSITTLPWFVFYRSSVLPELDETGCYTGVIVYWVPIVKLVFFFTFSSAAAKDMSMSTSWRYVRLTTVQH